MHFLGLTYVKCLHNLLFNISMNHNILSSFRMLNLYIVLHRLHETRGKYSIFFISLQACCLFIATLILLYSVYLLFYINGHIFISLINILNFQTLVKMLLLLSLTASDQSCKNRAWIVKQLKQNGPNSGTSSTRGMFDNV